MLTDFEQRLSYPTKLFQVIESPLEIADLKQKSIPHADVAYVVLLDETPSNNHEDSASIIQEVKTTIGIVIGITSRNDRSGQKGNAKMQAKRLEVTQRLIGWMPDQAKSPVMFAGGRLLALADNGLWWMDKFTLTHLIEAPIAGD